MQSLWHAMVAGPTWDEILKTSIQSSPPHHPLTCITKKIVPGKSAAHLQSLPLHCSLWKPLPHRLGEQLNKRDKWAGPGLALGPGWGGSHCLQPSLSEASAQPAAQGPLPFPHPTPVLPDDFKFWLPLGTSHKAHPGRSPHFSPW